MFWIYWWEKDVALFWNLPTTWQWEPHVTLFPVKALMKYENITVMDHLIIEVKNDRVGLGKLNS